MTERTPLTEPSIRAAIRAWLCEAFRDGREAGLGDDTPLVTSGLVDSAGVLEVVDFLETRFQVRIADEDVNLRNFDSVAGLAALVTARRNGNERLPGLGTAADRGAAATGFRGRNGAPDR